MILTQSSFRSAERRPSSHGPLTVINLITAISSDRIRVQEYMHMRIHMPTQTKKQAV